MKKFSLSLLFGFIANNVVGTVVAIVYCKSIDPPYDE